MIILVLNCGSSSLKYQLLDMKSYDSYDLLAKGIVERIGMEMSRLKHQATGKEALVEDKPIPDHTDAIRAVLAALTDKTAGVLSSLEDIEAVGHRVLHGGAKLTASKRVDAELIAQVEKCCDLGPLHNPANLKGIYAVSEVMPSTPQVAVFDTAFHQTMPDYAYTYAIPYRYYEKYDIRKYGFHGTSHRYVSAKGAQFAGLDLNNSRIITCHLGNGSSIAAVLNGKCVNTTMGLTPLDGLIMGTRSGAIDPSVVTYIQKKEGLTADQVETMLNKESGFLGVSGISSDFRDLGQAAENGEYRAKLALKKLVHGIINYVGAYVAEMNGVDLIIFTGGIGENNARLRRRVCDNLTYLGLQFDNAANDCRGQDVMITLPESKVKAAVICTNEELVIAQDTMKIVLNEEI
ncbi:MAG: acetate kinase [Bacteroidales bacterium]|nr:acetate kinase [Bacteroidales bacterium]